MKILLVAPYALWTPHLETDLEIAQRHINAGDEVVYLACNAFLQACDINNKHDLDLCLRCVGRRKRGLSLLSGNPIVEPLLKLTSSNRSELRSLRIEFDSKESLIQYKLDGFDIGWGVLSSLVSLLRDPDPDFYDPEVLALMRALFISSITVYYSVRNYIQEEAFDRAYVFNGRFAILRAAFRACQDEGITCYTHDRGCDLNHFQLYPNVLPHNIEHNDNLILKSWDSADKLSRNEIGSRFYIERSMGQKQNWISFTSEQKKECLPQNWDNNKRNIVIYISSEDEFVAIGDSWKNPLYGSQLEGLKRIIADLSCDNSIHVYLRVHPNLRNVQNKSMDRLYDLESKCLTIIPADSPIDSYALLNAADRILTFGSSVGIEATFWRKPSILAGMSFYRNLAATYNPGSHQEVMQLLHINELEPKPMEGALIYGHYHKTRGERFLYFKGLDVCDGLFKGKKIDPLPILGSMLNALAHYKTTSSTLASLLRTLAFAILKNQSLQIVRPIYLNYDIDYAEHRIASNKPLVTALICNYNYGRYLPRTIDSVLAQTWKPIEILVIDDGSTDESRSILDRYKHLIRIIYKENGGQASAFATGIMEARGEIICFLDSDDLWSPNKVAKVVEKFMEAPWGLVCHDLKVIDSNGEIISNKSYAQLNNIDLLQGDLFLFLFERGLPWVFSPTSGMSLLSSIAKKLLPLPTEDWKICADNLIAYGSICHAPTGVIKESLGSYRYHDSNGFAVSRKDLIWTRVEIIIRTVAVNDFLASHLSHINRSLPINIMDSYHFYRSVCFIARKQPWRSLANLLKKNIKYHFRENLSIASPFNSVRYIVLDILLACLIVLDLPSPYRQYRKHFNERILYFTQHTKEHLMSD